MKDKMSDDNDVSTTLQDNDSASMMMVDVDGQQEQQLEQGIPMEVNDTNNDPTVVFLETLCEPIREHVIDLLTSAAVNDLVDENNSNNDIAVANASDNNSDMKNNKKIESLSASQTDVFEIVLRELVLAQLQILASTTTATAVSESELESASVVESALKTICTLWNDCVRVCYHMILLQKQYQQQEQCEVSASSSKWSYRYINKNSLQKLPIVLLEDIVDVMSIKHLIQFWKNTIQVQSIRSTIFSSLLWYESNVASLPFLKVGNKLWKRLTSSVPLYPSSINTKVTNTNSTTSTTATTAAAMVTGTDIVQEQIDEIAADVMLILSTVYPISEKSAVRPWGNYNSDHTTAIDDESMFAKKEEQQEQDGVDDGDNDVVSVSEKKKSKSYSSIGASINGSGGYESYSLYSKFWLLQQDLCSPNKLVSVGDFLQRLQFVLPALENYPLTYQNNSSNNEISTPFITSSKIFHIQLSDPTIRIQLLTQYCIVVHHLLYTIPTIGTQVQSYQALAIKLLQQASDIIIAASNKADNDNENGNDALSSSSSFPYSYVNILNTILQQSETQWRTWKRIQKCSPSAILEDRVQMYAKHEQQQQDQSHNSLSKTSASSSSWVSSTSSISRKRKWVESTTYRNSSSYKMVSITDTTKISEAMSIAIPTYEQHLEDYVEALDPDAGIDDEYHPKRNTTFTWQALRLLAIDMIPNFYRINPNGDFENLVRYVYATYNDTIIPGSEPELYEWVESEDEKDTDAVADHNDSGANDHHNEDLDEEPKETVLTSSENGETNGNNDGDDRVDKDAEDDNAVNRTPMDAEENTAADVTAVQSPTSIHNTDENTKTTISNATGQKKHDVEQENYKSEGETEEHPDEEEIITELAMKKDTPQESKQDNEENLQRNEDKKETVSTNNNSNKRKRGMEGNKQTFVNTRNERTTGPHSKAIATDHISNRRNESSHQNASHFSTNNKASGHRTNSNNSGKTSTAWNHGPAEYVSAGREAGDVGKSRDQHQPWPRQQQISSNTGTTTKNIQGDRRGQDRPYHAETVPVDSRRGVGNGVGIRGATDTSAFESGRRGPSRDYPDDRRAISGSGVVDDDNRYDHRRDHRSAGAMVGNVDSRRSGGIMDNNANNAIGGHASRQSDDRGDMGGGGGSSATNTNTSRSRDDFPARNDDWRTSDRGNSSRRGGGRGGY